MAIELERGQAITPELIEQYKTQLHQDRARRTLMNAVAKNGVNAVALNHDSPIAMQYTFSHEIKTGQITHQKQSGRCWLFAGLNILRVQVARNCNLENFELSQAHMMFWDKFEKANYFLESILETLDEPTSGRLVSWLLASPVQDGGQWDMFVNLVEKYGVVPKYVMPETFHSSQSAMMNRLLTVKLREHAAQLREWHSSQGATVAVLRERKEAMLGEIYRMLCHFLGEPPTTFDFEYRDADKEFHRSLALTPQAFMKEYVGLDLRDFVSVINAPTADKPYHHTYTVQFLGNVKGGRDVLYLNVDADTLRSVTLSQLKDNEPVWFGCDVGKMLDRDSGIMDTALYDYEGTLGVPFTLTKAERLDYGESQMTHAMVFTGVNLVDGKPNRWKVENSWGKEPGNDGFFIMSDDWFGEFMYQVVVHKKYLSASLQQALSGTPTQLAPWDPMGSLA
ncbi:MAG: C1 family peptidase [Firmicutes bacterium]|nr:C1 family peptidase [Bacillota bacterium]